MGRRRRGPAPPSPPGRRSTGPAAAFGGACARIGWLRRPRRVHPAPYRTGRPGNFPSHDRRSKDVAHPMLFRALRISLAVLAVALPAAASGQECWYGTGAAGTADEGQNDLIVRGHNGGPTVVAPSTAPSDAGSEKLIGGAAFQEGNKTSSRDAMVTLKSSSPPGTYVLRYDVILPSAFACKTTGHLFAQLHTQDPMQDRVVVQLKRLTFFASSPGQPTGTGVVETVRVIDTARLTGLGSSFVGEWRYENFPLQIPASESPWNYLYYLEVYLITNRQPSELPVLGTGDIRGPAFAAAMICPGPS